MKKLFLALLIGVAFAQQPKPATETKLPDVKLETKLALRDAQTEWLAVNVQILQLEKQLEQASAKRSSVESKFRAAYESATAEAKQAGVDTDKNELNVTVGSSTEIKWQPKKEAKQ